MRRLLLFCGVLSSLLYVAMNVFVPPIWPDYDVASQTVSELSAIGAPTRPLWVWLAVFYCLFFALFGVGVWLSAGSSRLLKAFAVLVLLYSAVNIYWPPMHQRGNPFSLTDGLHIAWSVMATTMFLAMMLVGAAAFGLRFRLYTALTILVLIGFGALTGMDGPKIAQNLPTPMIGVWERIMIAAFLLWVMVLAVLMLRRRTA